MTMGILTYVKIGAAVVVFAVLGYFVYEYKHMETTIIALQRKVAGLELRAEIIEKAQAATDTYKKNQAPVVKKNVQKKATIDKVVEDNDNPGMRELYINAGMLTPSPAGVAPGRKPGNP